MVKNALNQSTAAGAATKVNDKMRPNKERKKKSKKMVPCTCREQQLGKYHLPLWKCDIIIIIIIIKISKLDPHKKKHK